MVWSHSQGNPTGIRYRSIDKDIEPTDTGSLVVVKISHTVFTPDNAGVHPIKSFVGEVLELHTKKRAFQIIYLY